MRQQISFTLTINERSTKGGLSEAVKQMFKPTTQENILCIRSVYLSDREKFEILQYVIYITIVSLGSTETSSGLEKLVAIVDRFLAGGSQ